MAYLLDSVLSLIRRYAVRLAVVWVLERLLLHLMSRGPKQPSKPGDLPEPATTRPATSEREVPTD